MFAHLIYNQFEKISPFTLWNWDDEHRLSRITSQMKDMTEYKLVRDVINAVRDVIFNSTISLQKFKKHLHELRLSLIEYTRDIEIRFNSILQLLKQIIADYLIVLKYAKKQCVVDEDCLKYPGRRQRYERQHAAYERQQEALKAAQQNQRDAPRVRAAVASPDQHAAQLLAGARPSVQPQVLKEPVPPKLPRIMDICNIMGYFPNLIQFVLIADYIEVFDNHAIKTGGTKWIKCMTIEELDKLTIILNDWKSQTLQQPKSPLLRAVLHAVTRNEVKCF